MSGKSAPPTSARFGRVAPLVQSFGFGRHEPEVIRGAADTIRSHRPVIVSGWAWDQEIEMLKEFGYLEYIYENGEFVAFDRNLREDEIEFTWFLLPEHHNMIH